MQETIWLSPTEYVSGDSSLEISYPFVSHPNTMVTSKTPGDLKWVSMGLRLPPNVSIEEISVCYQITSKSPNEQPQSFISQVRLVEMDTPDQALVIHDDPTDLKSPSPVCYTSKVGGKVPTPGHAVTLALRLNFQQTTDQILLGAVGVKVDVQRAELFGKLVSDLRATPGSEGQIKHLKGYTTAGDGGEGLFRWSDAALVDDGGTVFNVGGFGSSGAGWRRVFDESINVKWFGAVGDGTSLDDGPIQRAINAALGMYNPLGKSVAVYIPGGRYAIANPLVVNTPGAATVRSNGLLIRGARRSKSALNDNPVPATGPTQLFWNGASGGGPILQIENSQTGEVRDVGFDGNGLAQYCLQLTWTTGDVDIPACWTFVGCCFSSATISNVVLGHDSGNGGDGGIGGSSDDLSQATFENCVFQKSWLSPPPQTMSHMQLLANQTFSTNLVNCNFVGDGVGACPQYGIVITGGTVNIFGGLFAVLGTAAILMRAVLSTEPPALTAIGVEAQTDIFLLSQMIETTVAGQRDTVLISIKHAKIEPSTNTTSIDWQLYGHCALVLVGCRFDHDVNVGPSSKVFSQGVVFTDVAGDFTGAPELVSGNWSKAGQYIVRMPNLPTTPGSISGTLYRDASGFVRVV
jgi:hypothetical protein